MPDMGDGNLRQLGLASGIGRHILSVLNIDREGGVTHDSATWRHRINIASTTMATISMYVSDPNNDPDQQRGLRHTKVGVLPFPR